MLVPGVAACCCLGTCFADSFMLATSNVDILQLMKTRKTKGVIATDKVDFIIES